MTNKDSVRITAANENDKNPTSVELPLSAFVSVIARSYVSSMLKQERSA